MRKDAVRRTRSGPARLEDTSDSVRFSIRLAWCAIGGLLLAMLTLAPARAATVPEPDGFRMDDYRAATPETLKGAIVLDTGAAEKMWRAKAAVFLDVLPRPVKPANLPAATIWHDKRRDDIPGSAWLANVGYGALSNDMDVYFRRSLTELTEGSLSAPLVFYCQAECWMSWNAARRALVYGYTAVHWYPQGTDGWAAAGLPLAEAQPRP